MTFEKLKQIVEQSDVRQDAELWSDSGWECDETDMSAAYYSKDKNAIVFTRGGDYEAREYDKNNRKYCMKTGWVELYNEGRK